MDAVYSLKVTNEVTAHFNKILSNSSLENESGIVGAAIDSLSKFKLPSKQTYIDGRLNSLEQMIKMFSDDDWKLTKQDGQYILSALLYFSEEDDVIPDNIPGVGLLDDCIVIDIAEEQLKTKLASYKDFVFASNIYAGSKSYNQSDWEITKRQELFSRMRHRRSNYSRRF